MAKNITVKSKSAEKRSKMIRLLIIFMLIALVVPMLANLTALFM